MRKHLTASILAILLGAVAASAPVSAPLIRPAGPEEGSLWLYLDPMPRDAQRLVFRVDSIAAFKEDGTSVPLTVVLRDVGGEPTSRGRLFAAGPIPAGGYAGLSFRVASAAIRGGDTESTLRIPDAAVQVRAPFTVARRRGSVLNLTFDYRASVPEEFRFSPSFVVNPAAKPATSAIGVVSSPSAEALFVFDKGNGSVSAVIPTGRKPLGLALDPQRNRAYAALSGEDAVEVVDLIEGRALGRFSLQAGDRPSCLAITPDYRTLLVVNTGSGTVTLFDASSTALVEKRRIEVGNGPERVLLDSSGSRAFVLNTLSDTITVLGLPGGVVAGTVSSAGAPFRAQIAADGRQLYVIHRSSPYLDIVDTQSFATAQRIQVGPGASALKLDSRGARIYLGRKDGDGLDVYDRSALLPTDSVKTGGPVSYMTIDGEGNSLCIVLPRAGEVRSVRLVGRAVVARTDIPDPYEVVLYGER